MVLFAANLEENEKIKAELAPTKINEPKTPFHAPFGEEEDADEDIDVPEGRHDSEYREEPFASSLA